MVLGSHGSHALCPMWHDVGAGVVLISWMVEGSWMFSAFLPRDGGSEVFVHGNRVVD